MEDSNNNLNWTSDACAGVAMFGENDVQGVEVAWRWATAVRLSMCFGFPSSGLVRVACLVVTLVSFCRCVHCLDRNRK